MKTVNAVDYLVIALYMALMLGIGFYAARFNRGARVSRVARAAPAGTT